MNKVVDKIQTMLEWDIRKHRAVASDEKDFEKAHGLPVAGDGSTILAVTIKPANTIHIGPNVRESNFDGVLGHELGHVIMYQKYKTAIPSWIEEGLANYAAKTRRLITDTSPGSHSSTCTGWRTRSAARGLGPVMPTPRRRP